MKQRWLIVFLLILLLGKDTECQRQTNPVGISLPQKSPVVLTPYATIHSDLINESSGLVKSWSQQDVYWTHNDGGDEACIFALKRDGHLIQPSTSQSYLGIRIRNAENVDWEDITADNHGNLIIGDIGNNDNIRTDLAVYWVKEPDPHTAALGIAETKISFYYPDQKGFPPAHKDFDAEAIFWAKEKLYLLTKRRSDNQTALYRFDALMPNTANPLTLMGVFACQGKVTAADATPDGNRLAVLTYNAVWLFEVPDSSDNYFAGKIFWLPIFAKQCEGICFDGDQLLICNEQKELFPLPLDQLILVKK